MLADGITMNILSLSALYLADQILFGFLLLTSISFFQLGCISGVEIIKFQHGSKPCCWLKFLITLKL